MIKREKRCLPIKLPNKTFVDAGELSWILANRCTLASYYWLFLSSQLEKILTTLSGC